jgi:hypothetical protein
VTLAASETPARKVLFRTTKALGLYKQTKRGTARRTELALTNCSLSPSRPDEVWEEVPPYPLAGKPRSSPEENFRSPPPTLGYVVGGGCTKNPLSARLFPPSLFSHPAYFFCIHTYVLNRVDGATSSIFATPPKFFLAAPHRLILAMKNPPNK